MIGYLAGYLAGYIALAGHAALAVPETDDSAVTVQIVTFLTAAKQQTDGTSGH